MYFSECKLDETFLQQMLSENSTLQCLRLTLIDMTDEGVDILAKGLCKNSTLNELSFIGTDLEQLYEPSSEFTGMAEMLQTNDTLKTLSLTSSYLGSYTVTEIAEALGSNQGLEELSLMSTECDDEGAAALAKMLRMNKTLERLALCNLDEPDELDELEYRNSIGDEGATALADVLKECNSSLRELHLCRNTNITNTGLRKLIEAVQKNKKLTLHIDLPVQISKTLDKETMKRIQPSSDCRDCRVCRKLDHINAWLPTRARDSCE